MAPSEVTLMVMSAPIFCFEVSRFFIVEHWSEFALLALPFPHVFGDMSHQAQDHVALIGVGPWYFWYPPHCSLDIK